MLTVSGDPGDGASPGQLTIIGRKEFVSFPCWSLSRIRAKVDTGAYSSVLDVARYDLIDGPDGPIQISSPS